MDYSGHSGPRDTVRVRIEKSAKSLALQCFAIRKSNGGTTRGRIGNKGGVIRDDSGRATVKLRYFDQRQAVVERVKAR